MTVEELLQRLETLPDVQRVRTLIDLGRRADTEAQGLARDMEQRGFYERRLALFSCYGSGDAEHILRALRDPSAIIRDLAMRLAPRFCGDEQLHGALLAAPASLRRPLIRRLFLQRRRDVIDRFLSSLDGGDAGLCALVPFGSPAVFARHTQTFLARARESDWQRLGALSPKTALDALERWMGDATAGEGMRLRVVNALLPSLARVNAERTLGLVRTLARTTQLSQVRGLEHLARRRPEAVADLLLADEDYDSYSVRSMLHYFPTEKLIALLGNKSGTYGRYGNFWFAKLPLDQRSIVYERGRRYLLDSWSGGMDEDIVAELPGALRVQEARKQLKNAQLDAEERTTYVAFLPWDEALGRLQPTLTSTDAALRLAGLQALVRAVAYDRSRLGEALTILLARRMEQDGVRRVMYQELTKLPTGIWREEHLADLAEIARAGLNDVGLSQYTQQTMVALLLRVATVFPTWAAEQFATVLRERGWQTNLTSLANLGHTEAERVMRALLPVLAGWVARSDEKSALDAVAAFAGHNEATRLAQPVVEDVLRQATTRDLAERALALLAARPLRRLAALAPELLREDPSWVTFPTVARFLVSQRQDLLTPFLVAQLYAGRWPTGAKSYLPPLERTFVGGTAAQQARLAQALGGIIADSAQDAAPLMDAVNTLARLPALPVTQLAGLTTDARTVVRTTALFMLAKLDSPAGLDTLVEALRDDRARTAIRALRPLLREMAPDDTLAILRAAPRERVTVAKEIARLIGELRTEAAYRELLAWEAGALHRDVHIALLYTLALYLDHDETWTIYQGAASAPDTEVALALLTAPAFARARLKELTPALRDRFLLLVARLLAHPAREVRLQTAEQCARLGVTDRQGAVVDGLLALARSGRRQEAAKAVETLPVVSEARYAAALGSLITDLLPQRRLLLRAIKALEPSDARARERLLPIARAALRALEADPLTITLQGRLSCWYLAADDLAVFCEQAALRGEWHADALASTCRLLQSEYMRFAPEEWRALEGRLGASADERVRRLALSALKAWAKRTGEWDADQIERLRAYRRDAAPLVAAAAQFTLPGADARV